VASERDAVISGISSPVWAEFARARYEEMWDRATRGELVFGRHEEVGEIVHRPPNLLEMRVQLNEQAAEPKNRYLLRLYFAEPPEHDRLLLALHFARKPSAGDPAGTQQRQIREAAWRYNEGSKSNYAWGINGKKAG